MGNFGRTLWPCLLLLVVCVATVSHLLLLHHHLWDLVLSCSTSNQLAPAWAVARAWGAVMIGVWLPVMIGVWLPAAAHTVQGVPQAASKCPPASHLRGRHSYDAML